MKKRLTTVFAATALACSFLELNGQQAVGLYAGNHNTPYSAFQNPANVFPDKNRVYVNFWGANVGFTNNFLTYNAPFGLVRMADGDYPSAYTRPDGNLAFDQNWLEWEKTNNQKLYYISEVYGPSVYFRTSNRTALGFGLRGISGLSLNGVGPEVGRLLRYGLDSGSASFNGANSLAKNTKYTQGAFSIAAEKYQEWYFSLATVTRDRGAHFVKWGATGKLLLGMGSAGMHGSGFDFSINNNNQLALTNANTAYYHTDDASASAILQNPLGLKFDFLNGVGAGMDLGFVYEYRPNKERKTVRDWWTCVDEKKNDYDWKFGASITDLGFLAYNGSKRMLDYTGTKNWNINTAIVNQYSYNNQGITDRFAAVDNGFFDDTTIKAEVNDRFTTTTPVALNAQLDLNLNNNFFVGFNWSHSLKGTGSAGLRKTSYISVVPRWEGEHAEIGVPITLTRDYSALNVGLYGRLGPVIVGTDNLAGLASFVGNGNYKAANVYFGVRLKLEACGWRAYHEEYRDSVKTTDTLTQANDSFWKIDTVVVRDTVRIQKTDTVKVIEYRNKEVVTTQKELELRKKEADLKAKEDDIKRREAIVVEKENNNFGKNDDCSKRIAELEEQLKRERDLYAKLNTQYQDCKDEKDRLRKSIAQLELEINKLKAENDGLRAQNGDLQTEIYRLRQEITRLKAGSKPCDAQVRTLDSLLIVEQQKTANLEKEVSKQKALVSGKQTENDAQKKRIVELEEEIRVLKLNGSKDADCATKLAKLQAELDAEKAKSSGLQKQLDDLRKEHQLALDKVKTLEEQLKNCGNADEVAKIKAELDAQKKKCDELDVKVKALETENAALKGENSTLKAKVTALEKDITDLKGKLDAEGKKVLELQEALKNCGDAEQISTLKAQVDALKKDNSEKDAEIAALKNDKAKLESELSAAKAKITALEADLKECQSKDCGEIEAELAQLKVNYSNMKNQYDAVYAEYNALLADYKKLQSQLADCEQKLKNCSGSSDEINKLEAEISKLKLTITELNGQVDSKQKSLDELQEAYDKVVGEKTGLQKQIDNLNGQVKSLNAKVADLEAQLKLCKEGGNAPGGTDGN